MLPAERQEDIVKRVEQEGTVRVKELSSLYGVTEDCIRKDLAALEKKGLVRRSYGGAMRPRINLHTVSVAERKDRNVEGKRQLAQLALPLISENSLIFLDISTANVELARLLVTANIPVTVVTNMIAVMQVLAVPSPVSTIFVGGTFNSSFDGFVGSFTNQQLEHFRFDAAFMGAAGVDVHRGDVLTYLARDGFTKATVLNVSRTAYIMTETEKLKNDGDFVYAHLQDFTGILLDASPAADELKCMEAAGLRILL